MFLTSQSLFPPTNEAAPLPQRDTCVSRKKGQISHKAEHALECPRKLLGGFQEEMSLEMYPDRQTGRSLPRETVVLSDTGRYHESGPAQQQTRPSPLSVLHTISESWLCASPRRTQAAAHAGVYFHVPNRVRSQRKTLPPRLCAESPIKAPCLCTGGREPCVMLGPSQRAHPLSVNPNGVPVCKRPSARQAKRDWR